MLHRWIDVYSQLGGSPLLREHWVWSLLSSSVDARWPQGMGGFYHPPDSPLGKVTFKVPTHGRHAAHHTVCLVSSHLFIILHKDSDLMDSLKHKLIPTYCHIQRHTQYSKTRHRHTQYQEYSLGNAWVSMYDNGSYQLCPFENLKRYYLGYWLKTVATKTEISHIDDKGICFWSSFLSEAKV